MSAARFCLALSVDLVGRRVVVVGSGPELLPRSCALAAAGARVDVVSPSLQGLDVPDVEVGALRFLARAFCPEDLDGAWLAVAVGTEEEVRTVSAAASERRVWCHAVDRPALASVAMPAVLRRGRVVVAVGSGGASPAMVSWLRDRVAELVGPHVGELAELVAEHRAALLASGVRPSITEWRLLFTGLDERLRAGDRAGAERLADAWRSAVSETTPAGGRSPATSPATAPQARGAPGPSRS
jgi:uroporphyrin-III C-methyltransferase/precorrin-2 dehydrogenase/sirohydrochlorin ferrochelatase